MQQHIRFRFLKVFSLLALLLIAGTLHAQYKISGTVVDNNNRPVRGANVYLDNTLDGGTTDSLGIFKFTTTETGNQTIVASEISHETAGMPIVIAGDISGIVIHMKVNKTRDLDVVTITAGSFEASNDKTKTVLKPLDIVTTAGAGADVVKAIEMLPGTQQTGADNGLFVRGGDASEAAIVVDEMVVQNAFFSGPPGVATRSRFGAFNYQGVSFSSGGYGARYGQALSSILELNTTDLPDKSNVNLGIYMAGAYANGTKKWKNSALDIGASYTNTAPFFSLATTNIKFYQPPTGGSGNIRYVWKPNKDGILKASFNNNYNVSGIEIPNPYVGDTSSNGSNAAFKNMGDKVDYNTEDQYYYSNISYKQMFKSKYSLYTAASYSYDQTNNKFGDFPINEKDHRLQYRIEGKRFFTSRINLLVGTDVQDYGVTKKYDTGNLYPAFKFEEVISSGYTELEWTPINNIAIKPGVRYEHSALLKLDKVAPRLSMAIKTSTHSQISLAGGIFYQDADNAYLQALHRPGMQQATHYIANWQYSQNDRILRLEVYYKKYDNLIVDKDSGSFDPNTYRTVLPFPADTVTNTGSGYAQGIELFWRDKKSIKNFDYWVSYSYIDTKRNFANFPVGVSATPTFIAEHNFSLVTKYFVDKWHTNFSATYSYASGRPYFNPTLKDPLTQGSFLSQRTPDFNNLALTVAYLHTFGKWFTVFYLSLDNITNNHNVFGYRYSYDAQGVAQKSPIQPALYRSLFVGINMSLTQFKKDEL